MICYKSIKYNYSRSTLQCTKSKHNLGCYYFKSSGETLETKDKYNVWAAPSVFQIWTCYLFLLMGCFSLYAADIWGAPAKLWNDQPLTSNGRRSSIRTHGAVFVGYMSLDPAGCVLSHSKASFQTFLRHARVQCFSHSLHEVQLVIRCPSL